MNKLSQIPLFPGTGYRGQGTLGLEGETAAQGPLVLNKVISTTIGVLTVVAFIWFTLQLFVGAIAIISSSGDKQKIAEARSKITTSVIGLIVVISAIFIADLLGIILDLDILRAGRFVPLLAP